MGYLQAYIESQTQTVEKRLPTMPQDERTDSGPGVDIGANQTNPDTLPEALIEAVEERSCIMEHEGGLDRKEADRKAWCLKACMLSFLSQWQTCERFPGTTCLKIGDKG